MSTVPKPLHDNGFRWLFASWSIVLIGSFVALVALTFAVLGAMHTGAGLGIILAAHNISLLVFLVPAGTIADRYPRITILLCAHLATAVVQACTAILLLLGEHRLTPLTLLAAATGAAAAFADPAERGLVTQLTTEQTRQQANSLLGAMENLLAIVCLSTAGIITAITNGGYMIAFASVCSLSAAACLIPVAREHRPQTTARELPSTQTGWDEFRSRRWVWMTVAAFSVLNCIHCAVWTVLGPLIARQTIGVAAWGTVLGAYAAGVLTANTVMYQLTVSRLLRLGQISMALGGPLPLMALAVHAHVLALAASAFLSGLGFGFFGIAWETSLQAHIPENVFSRIAAFDRVGALAAIPLGQLIATSLAAAFGTSEIMLTGAITFLAVSLLPLTSAQVRHLSRLSPPTNSTSLAHERPHQQADRESRS